MVNQLSGEIDKHLKTLSFGLVQNSSEQIYKAHRELYTIGESVIPVVEKQILSQSWDEIKHGPQLNLLSGLLSLANDINEERARKIGEKIRKAGCSSIVDRIITSITTFTLNEFQYFEMRGLRIFLSKVLGRSAQIKNRMEKWLAVVPKTDLDQIERIYVVPESREDHRGTYMPILCSIMVEWALPVSYFNPLSWFFLWQIEKTLYHEIGHHVHRHTFEQDPEQEKEADQYAALLLGKSHPMLRMCLKALRSTFRKHRKSEKNV